jgi:hypothetical protein
MRFVAAILALQQLPQALESAALQRSRALTPRGLQRCPEARLGSSGVVTSRE